MYAQIQTRFQMNGEFMYSDELWKRWGKWFASERKARHLTQEEVAKRACIQRPHLSVLERGASGAKRDTVILLAQAIGIDPNEALTRAGYASVEPPQPMIMTIDRNANILDLEPMSEEQQQILKQLYSQFIQTMKKP